MKFKSMFDIMGPVIISPSSSHALRETAKGGLAATPTGKSLESEIFFGAVFGRGR